MTAWNSPIDLVPDFVPILGYADDVIVAAIAPRRVVRIAGSDAIDRLGPEPRGYLLTMTRRRSIDV